MAEQHNQEQIETYLDDLKTIKSLLIKVEDTPLIENWVFISWGIIILGGTLLYFILHQLLHIPNTEVALELWLPVILVGCILETIGWVRAHSRQALSLASPRVYKFIINFFSIALGLIFLALVVIRLDGYAYLGIVLLLGFAILFLNISLVGAYEQMLIYALIMLFTGIVFFIIMPPFIAQILSAGGLIGGSMLLTGLTKQRKEQA